MADEISIVVNAVDNFSSVLGNFGNILTGIKSGLDLVTGAISGTVDFFSQFVEAASGSEIAVTKLDTVLKSTNGSFGLTSGQLQSMATGMQNLSGFSDEAEMSAEAMLLRFENLNGIFPQALQLTNDLARSLGMDLTTAAQTIGKALDDPASGIGRLNTQFKLFNDTEMDTIKNMAENGDVAGAQALIMERLTEKVGGAAEAFGNTLAGQIDIAKEKLDNIKELIGGPFLGALKELIKYLNDDTFKSIESNPFIQFLGVVNEKMQNGAPIAQALGTALIQASEGASPFSDVLHNLGVALLQFQTVLDQTKDPLAAFRKFFETWDSTAAVTAAGNFASDILNGIANKITFWANSDGPQQLTDTLVSWVANIGTGTGFLNKIALGASNIVWALGDALDKVSWERVATVADTKIAESINSQTASGGWKSAGDAFGAAAEKFITDGWGKASTSSGSAASNAIGAAWNQWIQGAIGTVWFEHSAQDMVAHFLNLLLDELGRPSLTTIISNAIAILIFPVTLGTKIAAAARNAFINIGSDIQAGIQAGLMSMGIPFINWWIGWWDEHVVKTVKAFLRISSPSQLFADIGNDIVNGLINGITSMADWALGKIKSWLANVLAPFADVLSFLGIDTSGIFGGSSGGSTGSHNTGGTTTTSTGGTTSSVAGGVVNNYFYGPVYIGSAADLQNANYDCPSPNPLIAASSQSLLTSSIG